MLGAAETDFEAHAIDSIKKDPQIGGRRLAEIERYFRQQAIEQRRLPRSQRVALASPEEGARRCCIVGTHRLSCPALCRASTPYFAAIASKQDVDGRDKPGHDGKDRAGSPLSRDDRLKSRSSRESGDPAREVGLFPGEAAVLVGRASEMTVSRRAPVDRPVQLERA